MQEKHDYFLNSSIVPKFSHISSKSSYFWFLLVILFFLCITTQLYSTDAQLAADFMPGVTETFACVERQQSSSSSSRTDKNFFHQNNRNFNNDKKIYNQVHSENENQGFPQDALCERNISVTVFYPRPQNSETGEFRPFEKFFNMLKNREGIEYPELLEYTTPSARDAPAADGPFPLALISHGSCLSPEMYTFLAEYLSSNGYVVVLPNHKGDSILDYARNAKLKFCLEREFNEDSFRSVMESLYLRPQDMLSAVKLFEPNSNATIGPVGPQHVDIAHGISVIGHSVGSIAAASFTGPKFRACETGLKNWFRLLKPEGDQVYNPSEDEFSRICDTFKSRYGPLPQKSFPAWLQDDRFQALLMLDPPNWDDFFRDKEDKLLQPTLFETTHGSSLYKYAQEQYELLTDKTNRPAAFIGMRAGGHHSFDLVCYLPTRVIERFYSNIDMDICEEKARPSIRDAHDAVMWYARSFVDIFIKEKEHQRQHWNPDAVMVDEFDVMRSFKNQGVFNTANDGVEGTSVVLWLVVFGSSMFGFTGFFFFLWLVLRRVEKKPYSTVDRKPRQWMESVDDRSEAEEHSDTDEDDDDDDDDDDEHHVN